jgi:hypothetical protein
MSTSMKMAEEFRQNAEEWRQLERLAATDEHRRRIAEVANTWLAWAERRERLLRAGKRKARKLSGPTSTTVPGSTEQVGAAAQKAAV